LKSKELEVNSSRGLKTNRKIWKNRSRQLPMWSGKRSSLFKRFRRSRKIL